MIERQLAEKSQLQPDVQAYRRFVVGGAMECPIDSQGRILVPPPLRDHAQLQNKVTLVGILDQIEIWDTDLYEKDQKQTLARLAEIQQSVDKGSER